MTFGEIKERLFNNWQAKLLSFGLAILLYAIFQIISLNTKSLSIPLEVRHGGNFVLAQNAPEFVRVEVRGKQEEIATVVEENIIAYIDTSKVTKEGSNTLIVALELDETLMLLDPLDVSVYPDNLRLEFEESSFSWVPIEPSFIGSPQEGYIVNSWVSSPSDIKIMGAKSIIDSTYVAYAKDIDLNDKTQSFSIVTEAETVSKEVRTLSEQSVSVFVEIIPEIIETIYENIIPYTGTLNTSFVLEQPQPQITFTISGEKNDLGSFVPAENIIELDLSEIDSPGVYTVPVITNIPLAYSLDDITETEVTIIVIEATVESENTVQADEGGL